MSLFLTVRDVLTSLHQTSRQQCRTFTNSSDSPQSLDIACYSFQSILLSFLLVSSKFQAFAMFCMLYAFFWVIHRRLEFICRRFGSLYLFQLHRQVVVSRMTGFESAGLFKHENVWIENSWAYRKGVTGWGRVWVQKQAVKGNDPRGGHGRIIERVRARVGVSHGLVGICLWVPSSECRLARLFLGAFLSPLLQTTQSHLY